MRVTAVTVIGVAPVPLAFHGLTSITCISQHFHFATTVTPEQPAACRGWEYKGMNLTQQLEIGAFSANIVDQSALRKVGCFRGVRDRKVTFSARQTLRNDHLIILLQGCSRGGGEAKVTYTGENWTFNVRNTSKNWPVKFKLGRTVDLLATPLYCYRFFSVLTDMTLYMVLLWLPLTK